ncbi:leucine-rich repeat-containing protein 61 [Vidua chalybeata]|uniref:leucine-rich repeat-containing protein 61 n=1 Tax=Vidua chalybeata TaxID=81927 RepID=UPI0023A87009|nr:leucine-rich repeat-containing protein 61 [Vidua chalybeata]
MATGGGASGAAGSRRADLPAGMEGRGEEAPEPEVSEPSEEEEEEAEEEDEGSGVRVTPALLKATTGEFSLESILLLRLRGRGIAHLGCLADCSNLEWLDLSGNAIAGLAPLAALRALAVLNLAGNRVASVEPLRGCHSLRQLNLAGNRLRSLRQLRCLQGLRHLESLRLRDPLGNLGNPLCAAPAYRAALAAMLPGLKAIDGQRVAGRGSELFRLCRELDAALDGEDAPAAAAPAEPPQPWVQAGFWEARPARRSAVLEEATRQLGQALRECRELGRRADDSIAQAQRALGRRHHGDFGF